jgi:hypothetical protein
VADWTDAARPLLRQLLLLAGVCVDRGGVVVELMAFRRDIIERKMAGVRAGATTTINWSDAAVEYSPRWRATQTRDEDIQRRHREGVAQVEIARHYGLTHQRVSQIVRGWVKGKK